MFPQPLTRIALFGLRYNPERTAKKRLPDKSYGVNRRKPQRTQFLDKSREVNQRKADKKIGQAHAEPIGANQLKKEMLTQIML